MSKQWSEPTGELRILTCLHSFDPGGVERVALRLCEAWQSQGADVAVLLGRADGLTRAEAPPLNYVRYSCGRISTRPFETAWMILCMWRRVRAARPDVIFCPGNTYAIVAVALRLLLGPDCPPIVAKVSNSLGRSDMPWPVRWAYAWWLALQGPLIDVWVAMAPSLVPEIASAMRISAERIVVVEDPALTVRELDRLAVRSTRSEGGARKGRLFVSAGRLEDQKRFDLLIRAFAAGARTEDRLFIFGEGPRRSRLERLIRRLDLADRVELPGHNFALNRWLPHADAFVLASDYEGVPAVLVEALAAGVPIITTRSSPAVVELAQDGRFGQVVGLGDEAALAGAIAEEGPPVAEPEGQRRLAARFVLERAAPAYLRIMRTAADLSRRSQPARHGSAESAELRTLLRHTGMQASNDLSRVPN